MTKKEDLTATLIGYCFALPLCALIFLWYNYVWIQWPIKYWQWLVLTIPWMLIGRQQPFKFLTVVVGGIALIAQTLAWIA